MSLEESIGAILESKIAPVRAEVVRLTAEIEAMRRAIPPQLVTLAEAAKALGVSVSTVRRRVQDGTLKVCKVGRLLRVDLAALHPASDAEISRVAAELRSVARQP